MTTGTATLTTALTPDGKRRPFHAGHIRNGRLSGYVYVSAERGSKRVYGTINADCVGQLAVFEPTGANAHLVAGTFPIVEEVDTAAVPVTDDLLGALEESLTENIDFALANVD